MTIIQLSINWPLKPDLNHMKASLMAFRVEFNLNM